MPGGNVQKLCCLYGVGAAQPDLPKSIAAVACLLCWSPAHVLHGKTVFQPHFTEPLLGLSTDTHPCQSCLLSRSQTFVADWPSL